MRTCPYCAEQIQDAAVMCEHCGHSLRRLSSKALIMLGGLCALVLFAVAIVYLLPNCARPTSYSDWWNTVVSKDKACTIDRDWVCTHMTVGWLLNQASHDPLLKTAASMPGMPTGYTLTRMYTMLLEKSGCSATEIALLSNRNE